MASVHSRSVRVLHVGDDFAALRPCGLTLYAEGLMDAQASLGHDVAYVFSGRYYPRVSQPRLKRWRRGRVAMYELIGSPIHSHWVAGTRYPLHELADAAGEAAFAAALREVGPDVVHVHEIARLPSSIIELATSAGAQVVMTLHDFKLLCPTVRLLDADGTRCRRTEVGEDCARNCVHAPRGPAHLIDHTLGYESRRVRRAVPNLHHARWNRPVDALVAMAKGPAELWDGPVGAPPGDGPLPANYQHRRTVNVQRLNRCHRLVAPSQRAHDIHVDLGVDPDRLTVQRLTLPHLEQLRPRRDARVGAPLAFLTLGALGAAAKGSRMLVGAVEALERDRGPDAFTLTVLGPVEPALANRVARLRSIRSLGHYTPRDLDGHLDAADVGILPSTWEEVHGFVGIEMLAKGLPVIGSALGGIPEYVIEGTTGWLNRSVTATELVQLMAAAIDSPDEVKRLRENLRSGDEKIVQPMQDHVAEVDALYAELLKA